ncbi:hypothetical protein G6F33_008760 [Rhizopus arrhizus]|nr:hypothetical protein G6F24_006540 [Rhizopus arrhizus]KAG0909472.1 hypothetical protein G6F33_008760 [Rhizopus arrhizus]
MGFNCQLYVLRYVEGFYVLENVSSISFPTTYQDIKDNGIAKLLNCLETAKNLCLDLKKAIKTSSLKMATSKMANILSNKDQEKNKLDICSMVWPSDSEDDEDEESGEEDEKGNEDQNQDEDEEDGEDKEDIDEDADEDNRTDEEDAEVNDETDG